MTGTTPIDTIICGDCLEEMKKLPDKLIDAIVTDPPYELAFMGKKWDASGIAYNVDMWGECRIIKFCKTGDHTPKKVRVDIEYTKEEFELLGRVFERMLRDKSRCPDHMGDSVLISLQKRLMPPRARLLFGGEL